MAALAAAAADRVVRFESVAGRSRLLRFSIPLRFFELRDCLSSLSLSRLPPVLDSTALEAREDWELREPFLVGGFFSFSSFRTRSLVSSLASLTGASLAGASTRSNCESRKLMADAYPFGAASTFGRLRAGGRPATRAVPTTLLARLFASRAFSSAREAASYSRFQLARPRSGELSDKEKILALFRAKAKARRADEEDTSHGRGAARPEGSTAPRGILA